MKTRMTTVIDLNSLEEKTRFYLKLQLALRINAISIRKESSNPGKFDEYIRDRERIIRNMVRVDGELRIVEGDRILFP